MTIIVNTNYGLHGFIVIEELYTEKKLGRFDSLKMSHNNPRVDCESN